MPKNKKPGLFDLITHLNSSSDDRWYEFESVYNPFIINRFMSMHPETINFANEMNKTNMSKKDQYYFYLYGIPNKRRYAKYIKASKSEMIDDICNIYHVNRGIAKQYSQLLSKEQIKKLKSKYIQD